MLLSIKAIVCWNSRNKKYYESLGYKYTQMNDKFTAKIEDLSIGSWSKVVVKCDFCGAEYEISYRGFLRARKNIQKDCCDNPTCTGEKARMALAKKYGTYALQQLDFIKAKTKHTNLQKYGTTNPFANEVVKEKIRQTNLRKYGVTSTQSNPEIRAKTVNTCMQRYGVLNYVEIYKGKFKGSNSPTWKGGVSFTARDRQCYQYKDWRKSVFERDNYTCQKCHKRGHGIQVAAHHIKNWKDHPDERYLVENGITLCNECHLKFHNTYKRRFNTEEQIKDFLS